MAATDLSDSEADELRQAAETVLRHLQRRQSKGKTEKESNLGHKFVEEVSIMGLSEAIKAKHPCEKFLWMLVFITCLGTGTYFVHMLLAEYLSNPTATKVIPSSCSDPAVEQLFDEQSPIIYMGIDRTEEINELFQKRRSKKDAHFVRAVGLMPNDTYPFPPMAICVDTWLNTEKAASIGLTKEAIRYALSFLIVPYDVLHHEPSNKSDVSITAKDEFELVYKRENFSNLVEFFKFISLDAVLTRIAGSDDIDYSCVRCTGDTLQKLIIDHSVCYQLPLKDLRGRGALRQSYGWHEIVIRVPDLSMGLQERKPYWRLYVNPLMTKFVSSGHFISIRNGFTYGLRIEATEYHMLNKAVEPCREDDGDAKTKYSSIGCSLDCTQMHFKVFYSNCTMFNILKEHEQDLSDYCNTYYAEVWDKNTNLSEATVRAAGKPLVKCATECLSECDMTRYETTMDAHQNRHLPHVSMKDGGMPKERNMTAAKLYFINANLLAGGILTFREVYTYSFETLIGNIGGTCGIWIGASTLTFVQVLTFWSKHCVKRGKKSQPIRRTLRKL